MGNIEDINSLTGMKNPSSSGDQASEKPKTTSMGEIQEGITESQLQEKLNEEKKEIEKLEMELGIGDDGNIPTPIFSEKDKNSTYYSNAEENWRKAVAEYKKRLENIQDIREKIKNLGGEIDVHETSLDKTFHIKRGSLN